MITSVRDRKTGEYRQAVAPSRPMPKKAISDVYAQACVIGDNVRALIAVNRDSQIALAAYLGIGERTLRDRLVHPWDFRLAELEDIARRYDVTVRQLTEPLLGA